MNIELLRESNLDKLQLLSKMVFKVTDLLINKEAVGIIKKPTTGKELMLFQDSMRDILTNKLRNNLGV